MDVENVPPKRMKRRTSILPPNTFSPDTNRESSEEARDNKLLAKYIKAVEIEKKKWEEFESIQKAEYAQIKRNLAKPKHELRINVNYMNYIDEHENIFLSELNDVKKECKEYLNDLNSLKKGYTLLSLELRNQRKHLIQLLQKKSDMYLKTQMDLMSIQFEI